MTDLAVDADDLASKRLALEEMSVVEPHVIPVELMSGIGRLLKIVNNETGDLTFSMKEAMVEVRLSRPVYVTEISLTLGSFENVKGMRLVATDLLTNKQEKKSITVEKVSGPSVRFILNKVITAFVLHRESPFWKDIKKICVSGLFLDELEEFEKSHKNLAKLKEEMLGQIDERQASFDEQRSSIDKDREALKVELQASHDSVTALSTQRDGLDEKIDELETTVAALETRLDSQKQQELSLFSRNGDLEKRNIAIDSELAQKTETLSGTNIYISRAEERLKILTSDVNVFSEEFSGFVDQGRKQVNMYVGLALVPLLLLSIVVHNLFTGAADLSTKFQEIPNMDLLTLFVTRLPFVVIASLIIGISVKILFFLVNRIIAIHQQRLDLAKIAIIAKDVSDASATSLDMTVQEIYEAKTYLKMTMLRAYLSDQIEKFTYASRRTEELEDDDVKLNEPRSEAPSS